VIATSILCELWHRRCYVLFSLPSLVLGIVPSAPVEDLPPVSTGLPWAGVLLSAFCALVTDGLRGRSPEEYLVPAFAVPGVLLSLAVIKACIVYIAAAPGSRCLSSDLSLLPFANMPELNKDIFDLRGLRRPFVYDKLTGEEEVP
jgi:hypothetical protein